MKKYIIILFSILQVQSHASQIAVGLRSDNIIAWNIWENNNGKLKNKLKI